MQRQGRYCTYALLFLVIVFFALIRFRLRNMPLERDEGEYAYMGQLMLQGIPPYSLAYTMKLPGTHAAYAVILAVFGQSPSGIHFGLLLVNAATTLLVYMLAARLSGRLAGLVAAASYALLSTSFSVLGFAAHATHFVVVSALAGILLLMRATESRRPWQLFSSGFLLGLAFLMKQPGLAFAVFCGLYLLRKEWPHSTKMKEAAPRVGWYVAGMLLPFGLMCLILWIAGVFKTFWFWVFDYAGAYGSEVSFSRGVQNFTEALSAVASPAIAVWIIAALGLAFLWRRENRPHAGVIGGLVVCSFLSVCPGFLFRPHYFILLLPVIALLAGIAVHSATQVLARAGSGFVLTAVPVLLFSAGFGYSIMQQRASLFEMDPLLAVQELYGDNPFSEAVAIARYIDAHTSGSDRIAVLGSEPEIYFYAKRHSATGFIYVYGLTERQRYALDMQKQMIDEIESAHPQLVVLVDFPLSWLPKAWPQAVSFFSWARSYLSDQYELVGIADRVDNHSEYRWDDEAAVYQPRSRNTVRVFKRKNWSQAIQQRELGHTFQRGVRRANFTADYCNDFAGIPGFTPDAFSPVRQNESQHRQSARHSRARFREQAF
jgi:dolichyl-phosphate-mannose-protein mannosyltransferase